ncbi:hypothetical protein C8R44DRAFT_865356 [Mycena epipterygia]|nr:hypothetical protein C8R44DRAFT_865356 [Mycena epipterygia]
MPVSITTLVFFIVHHLVSLLFFVVPVAALRSANSLYPRFTAGSSQLSTEHGLTNSHTQIASIPLAASLFILGSLALGRLAGMKLDGT